MNNSEGQTARHWDGRIKLIGLAAVFIVPVLVAVALYFSRPHWIPEPETHGELIDPAKPLTAFELQRSDGQAYDLAQLRGHWTLLHTVGSRCDADCRQRLAASRQIHDALAQDRVRVRRLALASGGPETPGLAEVVARHPRLTVVSDGPRGPLWRQLPGPRSDTTVYLVDPHGNVLLHFSGEVAPDAILEDVEHALEVSRIG